MRSLVIAVIFVFPFGPISVYGFDYDVLLAPYVVRESISLDRKELIGANRTHSMTSWELDRQLPLALDQALIRKPAVATFRRSDGRTANPTTQGVRLRNLGATATSRTLVTIDGIPLNDPFGGWVYWQRVPQNLISSVNIYTDGVQGSWGNLSANGQIEIETGDSPGGDLALGSAIGSGGTRSGSGGFFANLHPVEVSAVGTVFRSEGLHTVRADQRGLVDEPAGVDYETVWSSARVYSDPLGTFLITGGYFHEERTNGTLQAVNESDAFDVAVRWELPDERFWSTFFYQDRSFQNVFASVNEERTEDRAVLDQFDVPSRSWGASLTAGRWFFNWEEDWSVSVSFGADTRWVEGEVNERFRNLGDGFTRERQAGGEQRFTGAFATLTSDLADAVELQLTGRVDYVAQADGFRAEQDIENDVELLDTRFADRDEIESSFRFGLTSQPIGDVLLFDLTGFTGFRAPTLNELYRPFRVGNDITEANPELRSERYRGIELGLGAGTSGNATVRSRFFVTWADDMIANVFLTDTPGFDPRFGFIPDGGSGSQRQNVPESRVLGGELDAEYVFLDTGVTVRGSYTFAATKFIDSPNQPLLEGRAYPQSPKHRALLSLRYESGDRFSLWTELSYRSIEFEDVRNQRRIDAATTVGLGARFELTGDLSLSVRVDNVTNASIQTGLATSGIVSVAPGRNAWVTLRYRR